MKSMLHEASSVLKAIEKAWNESGKPAEFTVKILEKGETNFLGFSKRPAIVSITYGSNAVFDRSKSRDFSQPKTFKKTYADQTPRDLSRERFSQPPVKQNLVKSVQTARPLKEEFKRPSSQMIQQQVSQQPKNVQKVAGERGVDRLANKIIPEIRNNQAELDVLVWNDEMVNFCSSNLKEIMNSLKSDCSFSAKINNKNLVITFDKNITATVSEDMKSFSASIAHLLMQFLKRKQKKRLKGLQIIVNTSISNEQSNSNKSN